MTIIDLFAGPGGWDLAARGLGLDTIGIEYDADACATRAAAGLLTIRADLAHYPPPASIGGLIASPPCQAFSAAGNREGAEHVDHLVDAISRGDWDDRPPTDDPNVWLALEVGRWIETARPRWIAMEQVPAVLPLWDVLARRLRHHYGYGTWCGVLNAADFGVPQTRRRAILIAHADRHPQPPTPTHDADPAPSLFDQRAPWVTMADALGLPADTEVGFPRRDDRGGDGYRERDFRSATLPSFALTSKGGYWMINTRTKYSVPGDSTSTRQIPVDQVGPVIVSQSRSWVFERPATTIAGDPRVWPPGHKINADDIARLGEDGARERYGDRAGTAAIRLPIEAALLLQTFPADYPLQGSRTSQFQQVGNAVPPLLARRLLEQLV